MENFRLKLAAIFLASPLNERRGCEDVDSSAEDEVDPDACVIIETPKPTTQRGRLARSKLKLSCMNYIKSDGDIYSYILKASDPDVVGYVYCICLILLQPLHLYTYLPTASSNE